MYGLIQICLKDLVLERFGESTWDTIRKNAGVEDKFVNFQQYDDDVTYRLAEAAAKLLGVDTDTVYELFGVFWVTWTMRIGYDKLICTLGKNLAEFISNLDFMHTVYMKTMYPMMEEPSFRAETRQDGSLTLHYFSVRHGLNGVVSGVIKGVSRIIFRERIDMDVIDYKEEYHRGVRKDHWVFHVRFVEFNLPAMGVDGKVSQEEWLSILVNDDKDKTPPTKDQTPDILAVMDGHQDGEFSAKIPDKILIDPSTFIHSFPYHVVFDRHLVIQHCGVKVQQFCPRVTEEGAGLDDFLSIRHPNIALTIENLRSFRTSIFIVDFKKEELRSDMQDKPTISLRGQMIWMDSEQKMVFLCSPRLTKLEDLTERGLHFSDIAPHDITRDLILFNQQRIAEVELSKQLEQKKEELRLLMRDLAEEKKKTDTLLYSMLPREVANELREGRHVQAGEFPQVTILFSDVVHFTDMCSQCQPIQIVHLLNAMYTRFDQLTNVCGVYKVETIGDAYMVVGGLPVETDAHAQRVARFGLQQLKASCEVLSPINGEPIQIVAVPAVTTYAVICFDEFGPFKMATGASAFSVWGKVGEEHMQCPVCQDYFKQPKILNCQHSVCEACLEKEKVSAVSKVECPVCWQATTLPQDGGVSALRTNFKLVDMVEAAHKLHQRERGSVPVCRAHSWKESRLYCNTCRELICEVCTSEAHSGHEHQAVGAAASEARRAAEGSITVIKALTKDLEDKLKIIQEVERDLKTAAEDSRQELDQRANEEIARVRAAKQRIKDEINSTKKARARTLADCKRECTVMGENMKSAVDGYRAAVDSGNYAGDFEFVSLQPKIAELAELGGRKGPKVDPAVSVLRFERFESEDNIRLGRLVDK